MIDVEIQSHALSRKAENGRGQKNRDWENRNAYYTRNGETRCYIGWVSKPFDEILELPLAGPLLPDVFDLVEAVLHSIVQK